MDTRIQLPLLLTTDASNMAAASLPGCGFPASDRRYLETVSKNSCVLPMVTFARNVVPALRKAINRVINGYTYQAGTADVTASPVWPTSPLSAPRRRKLTFLYTSIFNLSVTRINTSITTQVTGLLGCHGASSYDGNV